jgi:RNA polymerase sigma-70 factor, ECF subfamily
MSPSSSDRHLGGDCRPGGGAGAVQTGQSSRPDGAGAAAFVARLVGQHGDAITHYAYQLCGDVHQAEDLVQEALIRAWQRRELLSEERGSVRGWLLTVIRHLVIDRVRARQARPQEVAALDPGLSLLADTSEQVVTSLTVLEALARLSDDHRRVLFELYFRDRSIADVAAELAVPPGTVKSRAFYALRQLRDLLAPVAALD